MIYYQVKFLGEDGKPKGRYYHYKSEKVIDNNSLATVIVGKEGEEREKTVLVISPINNQVAIESAKSWGKGKEVVIKEIERVLTPEEEEEWRKEHEPNTTKDK